MSSSEWKKVTLGEVADVQTGPFGSQLHQKDYVSVGTPIITVEHLGENHLIHNDLPRVADVDKQRLSKYTLKEGDIVFSRVGSVDRRALVKKEEEGWLFSGRCLRVRPTSDKLNSKFLSYYFGLDSFKKYIRAIAVGSTMPSLNTTILSEIEIPLPPLPVQRRIADILSALDDKIELNRQTNATLEALAQSIFREWFVEFNYPNATGEMVESELGMIPKGWRVGKLGEICQVIKGVSYKSAELQPSNLALVTLKSINRGGGFNFDGFKEYTGKFKPSQLLTEGDLIFAQTDITQNADVVGSPAIVENPYNYKLLAASLDIVKCEPLNEFFSREVLFHFLSSQDFKSYCLSHTNGSTVLHLRTSEVPAYPMVIPDEEVLIAFDRIVSPIRRGIIYNNRQSQVLGKIRDALLPKLMSGEVTVHE